MKCPLCDTEFGDMQYGFGAEGYNFFGEKITKHLCPKCKNIVIHNWDTGEDYLEDERLTKRKKELKK